MRSRRRPPSTAHSRGVSNVIGTVLMVAIVVVLAAVIASVAIGFEDDLRDPVPSGDFEQAYQPTGEGNTDDRPYVVITHQIGRTVDGDKIVIRDESGNSIRWNDVWTGGPEVKAGEYIHIDGFDSDSVLDPICEAGDTYTIILERDQGDSYVVNEWVAPEDPNLPPTSTHDDDGDGIPNWC